MTRYPQGCTKDYFELDPQQNFTSLPFFWLYGTAGAGKTAILQAIAEHLCSPEYGFDEIFGGSFFFSNDSHIKTRTECTQTTPAHQPYHGNTSNASYKVNGCTAKNPYCRYFPIFIGPSTIFLSSRIGHWFFLGNCYARRRWIVEFTLPLLTSPEVYHIQIIEYSLETSLTQSS